MVMVSVRCSGGLATAGALTILKLPEVTLHLRCQAVLPQYVRCSRTDALDLALRSLVCGAAPRSRTTMRRRPWLTRLVSDRQRRTVNASMKLCHARSTLR